MSEDKSLVDKIKSEKIILAHTITNLVLEFNEKTGAQIEFARVYSVNKGYCSDIRVNDIKI